MKGERPSGHMSRGLSFVPQDILGVLETTGATSSFGARTTTTTTTKSNNYNSENLLLASWRLTRGKFLEGCGWWSFGACCKIVMAAAKCAATKAEEKANVWSMVVRK